MTQPDSTDAATILAAVEIVLSEHASMLDRGEIGHAHLLMRELAAVPGTADAAPLMALAESAHAALAPVAPRPAFRAELERALDAAAASSAARARRSVQPAAIRWRQARALVQGGAAVAVIGITAALWWRGRAERAEPV